MFSLWRYDGSCLCVRMDKKNYVVVAGALTSSIAYSSSIIQQQQHHHSNITHQLVISIQNIVLSFTGVDELLSYYRFVFTQFCSQKLKKKNKTFNIKSDTTLSHSIQFFFSVIISVAHHHFTVET